MDYQFTLKRFFVLVFLFVVCPIVGWVAYAHRTNAPSNMYESPEGYSSNNVTIPDDKLDMTTPFYQNDAAESLEKEVGRKVHSNAENVYYHSEKKEGENKEGEGKEEKKDEKKEEKK